MELIEITREEVINNCEKYYENEQQFFVKIKGEKRLHSAYLYQWEKYDDNYEEIIGRLYCFDFDDGESYPFEDEDIEHIYIIK